jgi:cytidyltransferase-like protein
MSNTVMISGGFDPIHIGHVRLIREAAKYGNVIVAMNSDEWIFRQKGFNSIGFKERKEFLMSIKGVIDVVSVNDQDGTVCTALIEHKPTYFANGGPRNKNNTPEKVVCVELGIEMLWGIGSTWGNPR